MATTHWKIYRKTIPYTAIVEHIPNISGNTVSKKMACAMTNNI